MLDDRSQVDDRDGPIVDNVFFCETCNSVMESNDVDQLRHKNELKHHKVKRLFVVQCAKCGEKVVDAYAEYSPEKNQFWCRNCIESVGYGWFRS